MFGHRYFGAAYFGPRYFGPGVTGGTTPTTTSSSSAIDWAERVRRKNRKGLQPILDRQKKLHEEYLREQAAARKLEAQREQAAQDAIREKAEAEALAHQQWVDGIFGRMRADNAQNQALIQQMLQDAMRRQQVAQHEMRGVALAQAMDDEDVLLLLD